MALLEIEDLHASVDGHEILKGVNLTLNAGEVHSIMGPNGSGKSTLAQVLARRETYEVTQGKVLFNGKDLLEMKPGRSGLRGRFPGVPVSGGDSRHRQRVFSALGDECDPQVPRRGRAGCDGFSAALQGAAEAAGDGREADEPLGERGLQRRREEAQRDSADGDAGAEAGHPGRDRFRPGHRCVADRGAGRECDAQPGAGVPGDHALSAAARLHQAGLRARAGGREDCACRADRNWRWNSKRRDTAGPKPTSSRRCRA